MIELPALFHEVIDDGVQHEDNEYRNKYVIDCSNVTDLQQFSVITTKSFLLKLIIIIIIINISLCDVMQLIWMNDY